MESLKLPKSGSGANTPTGKSPSSATASGSSNVSVTVRFNAGDECVESIYPSFQNSSASSGSGGGGANSNSPGSAGSGGGDSTLVGGGGDSLASSPSQHQTIDDQTNRNNFLQGNFFNRKSRSGSVEGISPTSSGPNLIAAFSGDTASSVGTWKLFKGKVSQTIEDIKSSKSNIPSAPTITLSKGHFQIELDSDQDSTSLNPSISDDNTVDADSKQQRRKHSKSTSHQSTQHQHQQPGKELETDSDIENETLLEGDIERSRIRRSLANLKSKVKAKASAHHHHHHHHHHQHPQATIALATAISSTAIKTAMPKESSPQRNLVPGSGIAPTANTSLRTTFLRKRRKQAVDTAEMASPTVVPEETIPVATTAKTEKKKKEKEKEKGVIAGKKDIEIESGVEMLEEMTPQQDALKAPSSTSHISVSIGSDSLKSSSLESIEKPIKVQRYDNIMQNRKFDSEFMIPNSSESWKISNLMPLTTMACLSALLLLPIHDFIRGIIATFLGIVTLETVVHLISKYIIAASPERKPFKIPDYTKMPILEIPSAEEHTIVKVYSGWMNELNSYDPNNFHITMTKSVYVKLEGTVLRLSTTTARIPKKVLWNEPPIDLTTLTFTEHRTFDLFGCRIELLPIGLARKRYFNRKYPIQLIIRNTQEKHLEEDNLTTVKSSSSTSKYTPTASLPEMNEQNIAEAKSMSSQVVTQPTNATTETPNADSDMDFASAVLNADLQSLHDAVHADTESKDLTVPRGDEVRLLLFSRGDREKEDWYRRFLAASSGEIHEQNLRLPNIKLVQNADFQAMATKSAHLLTNVKFKDSQHQNISTNTTEEKPMTSENAANQASTLPDSGKENDVKLSTPIKTPQSTENLTKSASSIKVSQLSDAFIIPDFDDDGELIEPVEDENFEGLIMSSCVSRNPIDYVRFMANYQHRRARRQENDLWKGIDQSLFLGPSGSVVWANVLLGRVIYSCLHDSSLKVRLKDLLQRKLSTVKLPSFMENVVITQIHLGDVSPLIHRVSQPMLDERGTWLDADVTYEGYCYITVTTKLNLLRLKRQARPMGQNLDPNVSNTNVSTNTAPSIPPPINVIPSELDAVSGITSHTNTNVQFTMNNENIMDAISSSAIFDSEAESSGGSSSESESPVGAGPTNDSNVPSEGNARRLFKLVDRFTASNLFQYATEISYVQRAMENMSANITLRVDLRGLVARGVINLPPPPSDRIWLAFRGPPRLWITAKPTVGDKSVDWSIVTNVIESKLCEQVNRYLVYPNMVDITIPFLGQPTYKE